MVILKILQNPPLYFYLQMLPIYNNTYIFHSFVEKIFPWEPGKMSSFQNRKKVLETLFKAWYDCSKASKCQEGGRAFVEQGDGGGLNTDITENKAELKNKSD